jgi:hypothetical protein
MAVRPESCFRFTGKNRACQDGRWLGGVVVSDAFLALGRRLDLRGFSHDSIGPPLKVRNRRCCLEILAGKSPRGISPRALSERPFCRSLAETDSSLRYVHSTAGSIMPPIAALLARLGPVRVSDRGWKTYDLRDSTIRLVRFGLGMMSSGCRRLLNYPFRGRL